VTVLLRRSDAADIPAIRQLTAAAFASVEHHAPPVDDSGDPGEATLVGWLLEGPDAPPDLSLVAVEDDGSLVGHVVCSRGGVDSTPALGLGPLSVRPDRQRSGIGSTLVEAVLEAAEARGEALVCLLGDPAYYSRFGFQPASEVGVESPEPSWGDFFQARLLGGRAAPTGTFHYAEPFDRL